LVKGSQPWDLGSQPVRSALVLFLWTRGSKFSTFWGSEIKILNVFEIRDQNFGQKYGISNEKIYLATTWLLGRFHQIKCFIFLVHSYLRSIAYREFCSLVYGFSGKKWIPLPVCAYTSIRKQFPLYADENYTGFELEDD